MLFEPLQDRVLVKQVDSEESTAGGIIIPDAAKTKPGKGTVVAIGEGKPIGDGKVAAMEVKKGDVVLFAQRSGSELKIGGEVHLLLKEDELLGVEE